MNRRRGPGLPDRIHHEGLAHRAEMFQGLRDGRRRDGRVQGGDPTVVPPGDFRSYYGRPVLKPPVWDEKIAAYLFTGGLAAGTAVLAAGSDLTGRPALRKAGWLGSFAALLASLYYLVADLGRPERFHHMLRVAKPTSPMSIGTWILTAFGPGVGIAAIHELVPERWRATWWARLLRTLTRPAGISSAIVAPGVASYSAVLLSHTSVPAWIEVRNELPFVFTGSAAAASGGFGMLCAPLEEAGPARGFAAVGAAAELVAGRTMVGRLDVIAEAYETGKPGRLRRASELLTVGGLVGTLTVARRNRLGAAATGLALMAGGALQRLGVFEAGVESTKNPRYVVVPQRQRLHVDERVEQEART